MRADMGKVITERERAGGQRSRAGRDGGSVPWRGHEDSYDDQPKRGKISPVGRHGWHTKEFTDVLPPIYGFLRKQIGRPWDKIYSELCKHLDKRKLTHAHVFTHVFQFVGLHVRRCTDGIYRETGGIYGRLNDQGEYVESGPSPELYVHPRTGLLRKNKKEGRHARKARLEREKTYNQLRFTDGREWRKIDGIWYDYRLVPFNSNDHFPKDLVYEGVKAFKVIKRQLSKQELRLVRETLGKKEGA